jgi:putative membrane protein
MRVNEIGRSEELGRPRRNVRAYLGIYLRGVAMGAADIVPGVSGGTMAFILGIYEEFISSLRMLGEPEFLRTLFRLRIRRMFELLNWPFLLALALGIFTAVLTLAHSLEWLLIHRPVYLWSFFFGLVLASIFTVSKRIRRWFLPLIVAAIVGFAAAYLLVGLAPTTTPDSWWFLILSGVLASCAMILPGISGAFILVLLGKYQYILNAVTSRDIATLAFVAAGAAVGIVSIAQFLSWLFRRYHDLTVAILTGLMLGSLRRVWPWKVDTEWLKDQNGQFLLDSSGELIVSKQLNVLPELSTTAGAIEFALALAIGIIGFVAILILERVASLQDKHEDSKAYGSAPQPAD